MGNFILFDDKKWRNLLPLTFTRPIAALRIGIGTISEKWETYLNESCSFLCEPYLADKFPVTYTEDNFYVYGGLIPNDTIIAAILKLKNNEQLVSNGSILAVRTSEKYFSGLALTEHAKTLSLVNYNDDIILITNPWHLFQYNDKVLRDDFKRLTKNKTSAAISSTNTILGDEIFIEEGVKMEACIINAQTGPVYIGNNTEVMEGCMLRGPLAIGNNCIIKMGAKIYGATTIGNHCRAGGEINNVILSSYSNKGHDGFLGNSVIGEWCNLGADTNNSNLKNNYTEVKLWDYAQQKFILTGLQFCGLIMGDHSKCGINTMFNTGTVVGVNANVFGDGFPRNFIPSFSWGGAAGFTTYKLKDALEVAREVMKRRAESLSNADIRILTTIYELSERYRKGQLIFLHR